MAKIGGNRASTLSPNKQNYYKQIEDNEGGFPWMLFHDRDELEKFWPSAMLSTADPPVAISIDPEFQMVS